MNDNNDVSKIENIEAAELIEAQNVKIENELKLNTIHYRSLDLKKF